MAGRIRIAQAIRAALESDADSKSLTFEAPQIRSSARVILGLGMEWFRSLFVPPLLPFQCLLYSDNKEIVRIIRDVPEKCEVYIDGIRLFMLVRALRECRPNQRIIVDLDDLLSRRLELLIAQRHLLSNGYMASKIPWPLSALIGMRVINRAILRHDAIALKAVEAKLVEMADVLVLVSSTDAAELRKIAKSSPHARAEVRSIPPAVPIRRPPRSVRIERFIFVGTDRLTQNRLTIDYLLALWAKYKFKIPLVIFGEQKRIAKHHDNVSWMGYVDKLEDIYTNGSVLISPTFLRGGIKTKVIEAFSYGIPVLGNDATFESLDLVSYPLLMGSTEEFVKTIMNATGRAELFFRAAIIGQEMLREQHDPEVFANRWRDAMTGP